MANDRMGSTAADRRPHTPYEEMVPIAVFDGVVRLRVAWPQDDPTDCEHTRIKRRQSAGFFEQELG
jgi:hypothetical protein